MTHIHTKFSCVLSVSCSVWGKSWWISKSNIDGLVQERRNSFANALELRLSCTRPSISTHPSLKQKAAVLQAILYHVSSGSKIFVIYIGINSLQCVAMVTIVQSSTLVCILRPRKMAAIFFNENVLILIKILLNLIPKGPINNISALVQIMAWCSPGNKPLSEPVMTSLPTHICITRPQWVKDFDFKTTSSR